jgi:hypothetical protein
MVVERFRSGRADEVGARFRAMGRLIPENSGIEFVESWMSPDGSRCYQLMKAPTLSALQPWLDAWSDLVEFEVCPVVPSSEFWSSYETRSS